jgi:diguanylate cyclase (GGDEF)-like protein
VLKDAAYLIRKSLRAFDLAYRLGGDEFLILVPGSDLGSAVTLAEELREAVAAVRAEAGAVPATTKP